jgi:outer membrane protein assembly factor BamB
MKKYIALLIVILVSLFVFTYFCQNVNGTHAKLENEKSLLADLSYADSSALSDAKINVLPIFQLLNDENAPPPEKDFSAGHLEKNRDAISIEKTEDGYLASMPGEYHIPSPSVYKGTVYVSGGFGSMEYYALDAKTGEIKWGITLDDDGPSAPAIDQDIIVFNTESCTIFACDVETGEHLWSYWMGDPLMSMPSIANDIVFSAYPAYYDQEYYNSLNIDTTGIYPTHVLIAFDLKSGDILWQQWIDGDVMSAPVAKGEDVYVTTFPGTLIKLNQKTGEFLSAKALRATSAPVVYENDEIYISRRSDNYNETVTESVSVLAMEEPSQTKDFRKKDAPYLDKEVQEVSALKSEAMNMDAGNGFGAGAPATSGWEKANENVGYSNVSSLQQYQGSRTLNYNGMLYNTMGDEMICTDGLTGEEKWRKTLGGDMAAAGGYMGTPPLEVGGYIIVADFEGTITIVESKTGELVKEYKTKLSIRSQPVVAEGWIYATTVNGKLVAIDTKMPAIDGWPTWGANAARTNVSN